MKKFLTSLALVATLTASPAYAKSVEVADYGGWTLYRDDDTANESNCGLSASFGKHAEIVSVIFYPKTTSVIFAFQETDATSLKEDEEKTLGLYFVKNGGLDDGWGEKKFKTMINDDGVRTLYTNLDSTPFLKDLAASTAVGVTYKDKVFTAFNLKGTAEAVAALKACAYSSAGYNPKDPFIED